MKGRRVISTCVFLLFLLPLRCSFLDGEYLKPLVTVWCLCWSYFEFGFKQFGDKKSALLCSTLLTLTNLRCFPHPENNVQGIAVDHPLSCWYWNDTITTSHHSYDCLVDTPAKYPIGSDTTDVLVHIILIPRHHSIHCSLVIWYLN